MKRDESGSARPNEGRDDLAERLWRFRNQYREARDPEKILRGALRLAMESFRAPEGCVATLVPGSREMTLLPRATAEAAGWDRRLMSEFLRGAGAAPPRGSMLARVRRRGRMWGVLVVRAPGADFSWGARETFARIGGLAEELVAEADLARIREVRARIDRKMMEEARPKHLAYEVLHGIRSLIAYDHSAALWIHDPTAAALEVVAEQVAWRKAKGENVGRRLSLSATLREALGRSAVLGFDRDGPEWRDWTGGDAAMPAELLDHDLLARAGTFAASEGAVLYASLATREGLLGVLKVASVHPGSFRAYEVELISQFPPQAAVALRNARRVEGLERRMIDAERKHAMADLARSVAHDVGNALGAVLPLAQQLAADLDSGAFDAAAARADLRQMEQSIQTCRRIFEGMLNFARGASPDPGDVALRRAVDSALAIVREGIERRGVALRVDVPDDLPRFRGVRADVERLLLNLLGNARDATESGGSVAIRARVESGRLMLEVEDDGVGIPPEHLARLQEPFFTTKADGHGLGLAICRSIAAQLHGRLDVRSATGRGTTVAIAIPIDEGRNEHGNP